MSLYALAPGGAPGGGLIDPDTVAASAWFDGSADYLSWTPSTDGSADKGIIAGWVKRCRLGGDQYMIHTAGNSELLGFSSDAFVIELNNQVWTSAAVFRDTTGWYHLLVSWDMGAAGTGRAVAYVNGVEVTAWSAQPTLSSQPSWFEAGVHHIGRGNTGQYFNGYIAQIVALAGVSIQSGDHAISDFIGTNSDGFPIPLHDAEIVALTSAAGGNSFCFSEAIGDGLPAGNHSLALSLSAGDITPESDPGSQKANLVDTSTATRYYTGPNDNYYIDFDFGIDKIINAIGIWAYSSSTDRVPTGWHLYGSATGAFSGEEIEITSVTGGATYSASEKKFFPFTNTTGYRHYRFFMDEKEAAFGAGNEYEWSGIEFFEEGRFVFPNQYWTPTSISLSENGTSDTPSNNMPTLNVLNPGIASRISRGNLFFSQSSASYFSACSLFAETGKFYCEVDIFQSGTNFSYGAAVVPTNEGRLPNSILDGQPYETYFWVHNGVLWHTSSVGGYATHTSGDTLMIALDMDNGWVFFGKNGVWYQPSTTTGTHSDLTDAANAWATDLLTIDSKWTFGTGHSNSNGFNSSQMRISEESWVYTPPDGFIALTAQNTYKEVPDSPDNGSFIGNASTNGPNVYLGYAPSLDASLTINGNAVTWGTHADPTATGFKVISSSASYNTAGANTFSMVTTNADPRQLVAQ